MLKINPIGPQQAPIRESGPDPESGFVDVQGLINLVRRQKRLIIGAFILFNAIVLLGSLQIAPLYTATSLVVVDSTESQLLGIETEFQSIQRIDSSIETEVEIARSNNVAQRVLANVELSGFEEFRIKPSLGQFLRSYLPYGPSPDSDRVPSSFTAMSDAQKRALVDQFQEVVRVNRRGQTSVIAFSATMRSPANAAAIANAASEAYLDEQIAAKLSIAERATQFLRERVNELGVAIQDSEADIDRFVIEKTSEIGSPEIRTRIAELRENLAGEERQRAEQLATLNAVERLARGEEPAALAESLQETELARLARERADFSRRLRDVDATDTAGRTLRTRVDELDARLTELAEAQRAEINSALETSRTRSTELRSELQSVITSEDLPSDITVDLYRLQRDASASRELYDSYLSRLRQIEQRRSLSLPDSRVVAEAILPTRPSFPPRMLILAASLIGGLGLGLGIAFLRENYIGGFMTVEQIESVTGVPVLSIMPHLEDVGDDPDSSPDRMIIDKPFSVFSESIRRLRLGIDAGLDDDKCHVVVVTSSEPNEGKSTIALALARAYSLAGKRTILVDADLRHPAIYRRVKHNAEHALADFLSGPFRPELIGDMVLRERDSGLDMILSSRASRIATDTLLGSSRFNQLVVALRGSYDVVIVDTPPIGFVVDAQLVAAQADTVIYAIRWASTSQRSVRMGLRELSRLEDKRVFAALNQAGDGSHYGYSYKYSYYYNNTGA